jgi:hypothetical protein
VPRKEKNAAFWLLLEDRVAVAPDSVYTSPYTTGVVFYFFFYFFCISGLPLKLLDINTRRAYVQNVLTEAIVCDVYRYRCTARGHINIYLKCRVLYHIATPSVPKDYNIRAR